MTTCSWSAELTCFLNAACYPCVVDEAWFKNSSSSSSSSMALQSGVDLGLLYNTPPSLSIPCSVPPFVYSHLSQVRGQVIQPSHFWSSSSSCCIQLSVQYLFWNCGVVQDIYIYIYMCVCVCVYACVCVCVCVCVPLSCYVIPLRPKYDIFVSCNWVATRWQYISVL